MSKCITIKQWDVITHPCSIFIGTLFKLVLKIGYGWTTTPHKTMDLTHWGPVTHVCVSKLTIIGWDNGLSLVGRQAIISTNAGILLIGNPGRNFNEISIKTHTFSFKKIHLKMSSAKRWPFCLSLNVLASSTPLSWLTSINDKGLSWIRN